MPPKKGKGRAAANKVTKPAQKTSASTRRASGRIAAAVENETERQALTGKPNNKKPKAPTRGRKAAAAKEDAEMEDAPGLATPPTGDEVVKPKTRGRPKKAPKAEVEREIPDSTRKEPTRAAASKKGGRKAAKTTLEEAPEDTREEVTEIPETQPQGADPDRMEVDPEESEEVEDLLAPEPAEYPQKAHSFGSAQKPTAAASSEGGDPALRRRLGEMTRKYESLDVKYRDLRELAVKEAERNFDRLKKQAEERATTSKELIANLKAELATQKELAREGQRLKKQLEANETKISGLQSEITQMTTSLSESKAENKSLNMKLSASRNAEAAAAAKAVPGSAMKGSLMRPNTEAIQQATKASQMKLDLYGDLSGLIIRSVKHEGDEDVYDCIQTGRDGRTLHFKLFICNDPSLENYEEAESRYQPFLDESRDRELIDVLPDYLVDEIEFPRHQCAKFYAKLLEALHQKYE